MGLFDIFSTDAAEDARDQQVQGIRQGMAQYAGLAQQGRDALTSNFGTAVNTLGSTYGSGRDALGQGIGALNTQYGAGLNAITGAYGAGISGLGGAYSSGLQPFQQLFGTGMQGTGAYGDAMGLNGPEGNARATAGFWNNPGIQAQLDIGSENVMRRAAQTGQLGGGAMNVDLQNLGQQVAAQGWGNYVNQLSPYLNFAQNAASGMGNLYSGYGNQLANMYSNLGNQQGGLYQGLGQQLAGQYGNINTNWMNQGNQQAPLYANLAGQLAASYGNQGQMAYGGETSMGNANANAELARYNASGNALNFGMNLAGMAMGMPGVGSMGSSIARGASQGASAMGGNSGNWASGLFKSGYGTPSNLFPGYTGQGYAEGGRPPVGEASMVGERGPEMFVPDRPGTIIPNEALTERSMNDYIRRDPRLFAARLRSIADSIDSGKLGGGEGRTDVVSPPMSRDSAYLQDAAENAYGGAQVVLPNYARRMLGMRVPDQDNLVEDFVIARGGGGRTVGRGSRFTPMSLPAR